MFNKILVANRGEIACRVMRTARRLGIATVAVYSDADASALHVQLADEAVYVGEAPSAKSYLVVDAIIDAVKSTGAQAVHPGYGFLSENAQFAERLDAEGIAFIGPPVGAITAMGDKITSKLLAAKSGVNTIPGHTEVIRDADEAVEIANKVGYPVMLKASAGGGGKGMRVARDDAQCREGFVRASSEAASSFGDDRVFIERFIDEPRHIEIQVLADKHGNTVYLGERECSIQRRHQKVIEEAPSPFLDEATRAAMGAQAVLLAQAVDYCSAGTVEFIVDTKKNFYFLEMNTRLQVEHPVTELVTGLDLVEEMLRVAAGEKLRITQDDVKLTGWAVEARIYAEDPLRNFLPSVGRVELYREPEEAEGVRVDAGVYEGGEVSIFYDPMISKLIGYGADREQATQRLRDALDAYVIRGPVDNSAFLATVLGHPRFIAGDLSTAFIDDEFADGFTLAHVVHEDPASIVAVAASIHLFGQLRHAQLCEDECLSLVAVSVNHEPRQEFVVQVDDQAGSFTATVDGKHYDVTLEWSPGAPLAHATVNGIRGAYQIRPDGIDWHIRHRGYRMRLRLMTPRAAELFRLMPIKSPPDMSQFLLSPMPGLLVQVMVSPGERVEAGTDLAVVEAMKMENVLRAERDGVVKEVLAGAGESLAVDQAILEFE
jgi:propionyl-CoA carboxylase alpha chain